MTTPLGSALQARRSRRLVRDRASIPTGTKPTSHPPFCITVGRAAASRQLTKATDREPAPRQRASAARWRSQRNSIGRRGLMAQKSSISVLQRNSDGRRTLHASHFNIGDICAAYSLDCIGYCTRHSWRITHQLHCEFNPIRNGVGKLKRSVPRDIKKLWARGARPHLQSHRSRSRPSNSTTH